MVTFTEEILNGKPHFYAVNNARIKLVWWCIDIL